MKREIIILLFCLTIISLTPVFADDVNMLEAMHITPFSEDTVVTIDGIEFNIPAEFGEDGLASVDGEIDTVNDVDMITFSRTYKNENLDNIFIDIHYDELQSITDDMIEYNGDEKIINNVTGYYSHEDSLYSFDYVIDGKSVSVTASSEELLNKVIM